MERERPSWVSAAAVIAVGLFTLLGFVALASYAISAFPGTTLDLALVVVLAVISLMSAVGFIVVAYSFFGLHDRKQALGLPEGSVRALVAMMLVIIFSIFAVYFFDRLDATARAGQADFAKQVIALIGTLLTAIVSFYFASRASSETITSGTAGDASSVGAINPTAGPAGEPVAMTVTGSNLFGITKARLVRGANEIVATNVSSSADRMTVRFAIPQDAAKGKWDLVVEAPPKPALRVSEAFEVK
ncbi:MAG TPA: hypothetical protein VJZ76_08825 [Thermoanaerobaculia bacterium]|nr:hypothetical protein [Thermoanaerobaculia bacterium]